MKQTRRKNALQRLEKQLASGVKPITPKTLLKGNFDDAPPPTTEPLTEHDRKRIKKEVATLKERV